MAAIVVETRRATIADVYALALNLRAGDRAEIAAMGRDPRRALRFAYRISLVPPRVATVDGEVAAMWGLGGDILSDVGEPWLLTGHAADRVPFAFVRIAKAELAAMLAVKRRLENYVAADYPKAVRLLDELGFKLDEAVHVGQRRVPFRRFHLDRDDYDARERQTRLLRPGAAFAPFIVHTAGRSRTAWLAAFLSYGRCRCDTEAAIRLRGMQDMAAFFARPGAGSTETAAAPGWRLLRHYVPGIKSAVVRRAADEIIASFARSEVADIAAIDEEKLRRIIAYEVRCLDQISRQPGVLTVDFHDLAQEATCSAIFEHCLPYRFDAQWWHHMKDKNVQSDVRSIFSYYRDNRAGIEEFKRDAKREMIALARAGKL